MRVTIAHNMVGAAPTPDERDVLVQVETVAEALAALGHVADTVACGLDLGAVLSRIRALSPHLVFNLVESLDGKGHLIHLFPFLLDAAGVAYTGCSAEAVLLTSNKAMAKWHMRAADLPTPDWVGPHPPSIYLDCPLRDGRICDSPWIIKSVWEHASVGMDETSIVEPRDEASIRELLKTRAGRLGGACFAERFVEGREFNLSLLALHGACHGEPQLLPPAEILFQGYGENKPRIVDYRAKWDDTSYEFHNTPRRFEFGDEDDKLIETLKALALRCWRTFGLRGYARVDFRVDSSGRPWILEVNTNPCLSPDAGYAAALAQAGVAFSDAVQRILEDANSGGGREPILKDISLRSELRPQDPERIRHLVEITGFFSNDEVQIAAELPAERLAKGPESGYYFLLAEQHGRLIGYTCYGPIACTAASYDLYWIAVHPDFHRRGIGRHLIMETERLIKAAGGTRIYVETSQRQQYASTRAFYERCGYRLETVLTDFYGPGDGKAVYCKALI